ncbi:NACHT [Porites harrisoni]
MLAISQGPNTDEQNSAKKTAVICQVEKPSFEKRLDKGAGAVKTAKRSRSSRKGKRPLSSCAVPSPKQQKLLKEEGWNNSVVVELLKAEYKRRCLLRPLLWDSTIELPLENVYTRLKIVSRRKLATQMEAKAKANMFHVISSEKGADVLTLAQGSPDLRVDVNNEFNVLDFFKAPDQVEDVMRLVEGQKPDLVSGNDEVNVTEIFKTLEKGKDVMALVEGSPGIGKTTFCLKLAYDCTHGKIPTECSFPMFEVVLLLKCRDIDGNIMDTIREQLLPRDIEEKIAEKLLHFLKDIHNQERILIILDGLDELPEKSRHHVDELLHRRIFPFCYVLATTRQERGIEARKTFVFDIHLEIKGYTESDSIAYVRRHFETIGQSPKGERLIEEMQQNTFLNALRNNPLNLLLLCVVYEDYEGKLPTSRTELYHVIVRCLLRRYCAKRNWPAPEDDSVLEKMFEKEILALGELAWLCLLSDRYGFRETEMDEFERKYPGLVARELGLLYKEESLKRLKPQHEYCFLHKTFQEYVAAAYIAQKLRNQKFNVFRHLNISFDDIVTKYPQVFTFVSGMLGEKATVLFTQIGEELRKFYDWNWNELCNEKIATFFIQSFDESGHAAQMAVTLCNMIPFPKVITSKLIDNYNASFIQVLKACRSFSNLQTPVELYADIGWGRRGPERGASDVVPYIESCPQLTSFSNLRTPFELYTDIHVGDRERGASDVVNYVESCPQLTIVSFRVHDLRSLTSSDADRLCKWFSASRSLSEFTLKYISHVCLEKYELLVQIGRGLASCRTLTKVTFALPGYAYNESFFNAFETGLTMLTSVNLVLWGSMKYTATRGLQHFLSNKSFNSLSLCTVGCVLDLLVAAVSQALDGPLSSSSASFLEKGLMENSSLNCLRLRVHGELPGNWYSVVENVRVTKKSPVCCSFYPNTFNNVANNDFRPVLVRKGLNVKQHLTVNVWGEMKCETAEALWEVLAPSSITVLTLNMRGNLTSEVSNSIARCLEENKTLSSLSINIWGELITDGGNVPSSLSKNSRVQLNVHDVRTGPDESNDVLVTTTDNPAALTVFFTNVKERRKQNVRLTINNDSNVTKEWTRCLGDALAENTSLTTLDLTVNNCVVDADLGENLGFIAKQFFNIS